MMINDKAETDDDADTDTAADDDADGDNDFDDIACFKTRSSSSPQPPGVSPLLSGFSSQSHL